MTSDPESRSFFSLLPVVRLPRRSVVTKAHPSDCICLVPCLVGVMHGETAAVSIRTPSSSPFAPLLPPSPLSLLPHAIVSRLGLHVFYTRVAGCIGATWALIAS